jgi:succinate dehydrogenase hydrophobic anchor subunit
MKELQLIGVSLLVILWWVGVWGCIETLVHSYTRNNPTQAFCVYFSLAAIVLGFFVVNPTLFTKVLQ